MKKVLAFLMVSISTGTQADECTLKLDMYLSKWERSLPDYKETGLESIMTEKLRDWRERKLSESHCTIWRSLPRQVGEKGAKAISDYSRPTTS